MICPNCEKEIENNIAQCPYCGCHFSVQIESKSIPIPMPVVEERQEEKLSECEGELEIQNTTIGQVCPTCGKSITTNAQFCKWCGTSLSQAQENPTNVLEHQSVSVEESDADKPVTKVCENCGHTIIATALFCKWCGNSCNDKKEDGK